MGYPQPEDLDGNDELEKFPFNVFPYLKKVFEITKRSENFGIIRGKQIGSISLLSEPKWNKKGIGTIYWLEDTFFTTPSIYENIFKPLNIQSKSVIGYGNQKPLVTVVQLLPQGISSSKLNINDNNIDEKTHIPEWEITRFHLNNKGFFRLLKIILEILIFLYLKKILVPVMPIIKKSLYRKSYINF